MGTHFHNTARGRGSRGECPAGSEIGAWHCTLSITPSVIFLFHFVFHNSPILWALSLELSFYFCCKWRQCLCASICSTVGTPDRKAMLHTLTNMYDALYCHNLCYYYTGQVSFNYAPELRRETPRHYSLHPQRLIRSRFPLNPASFLLTVWTIRGLSLKTLRKAERRRRVACREIDSAVRPDSSSWAVFARWWWWMRLLTVQLGTTVRCPLRRRTSDDVTAARPTRRRLHCSPREPPLAVVFRRPVANSQCRDSSALFGCAGAGTQWPVLSGRQWSVPNVPLRPPIPSSHPE